MNILVIGNGFDLAHGLPTKYSDFLKFCEITSKIYESEKLDAERYEKIYLSRTDLNEEIKKKLLTVFASREECKITRAFKTSYPETDELYSLIKDNFWIEYFLSIYKNREKAGKNGWIDFESEISEVIQSLDNDMHRLSQIYNLEDIVHDLSNGFLKSKYLRNIVAAQPTNQVPNIASKITFKEIRNKLLDDLNKFIRAFEIYLTEYVEKIDCNLVSPNIQKILSKESKKISGIPVYDIRVLSFNYTNTFQRLYIDKVKENKYFENDINYIHGEADINNNIESNNMVLGIDEYLPEDRRNKDVEFIAFKKFYQRIYKQTGSEYKKWIDYIKKDYDEFLQIKTEREKKNVEIKCRMHNLYIFGHSLDVTDKDILRDLILNDNVYTTFFYHDKDTMGQQIANLVKVIGQDELIRRTGGSTKSIYFKPQEKMLPIESQ